MIPHIYNSEEPEVLRQCFPRPELSFAESLSPFTAMSTHIRFLDLLPRFTVCLWRVAGWLFQVLELGFFQKVLIRVACLTLRGFSSSMAQLCFTLLHPSQESHGTLAPRTTVCFGDPEEDFHGLRSCTWSFIMGKSVGFEVSHTRDWMSGSDHFYFYFLKKKPIKYVLNTTMFISVLYVWKQGLEYIYTWCMIVIQPKWIWKLRNAREGIKGILGLSIHFKKKSKAAMTKD